MPSSTTGRSRPCDAGSVTKPRDVLRGLARLGSDLGVALDARRPRRSLEGHLRGGAGGLRRARACSIAVFDPEANELVFRAATGSAASSVVGMRLPVKRGIAGYVVASGQAIAVHDVQRDPRFDREAAEATGYLPQSILAVPIETASEVSGVIEVLDWTEDRIGEVGLELAAVFARQAALALAQAELFADLGSMLFAAASEAAKSEDPDLADALRTVANKAPGADGRARGAWRRAFARSPRSAQRNGEPRSRCSMSSPTTRGARVADDEARVGGRVRPRPAQRRSSSRRTGSDHAGLGVRRWSRRRVYASRWSTRASRRATRWSGALAGAVAVELDDGAEDGVRFVEGASRRLVRPRHRVRRSHPGVGAGRRAVQRARPRLRAHRTGERVRRGCAVGDRERHAGRQPLAVDLEGRVVRHLSRARRPRLLPPMCRSCRR